MRAGDALVPLKAHIASGGAADRQLRRLVGQREDPLTTGVIPEQQVWSAAPIGTEALL